MDEVTITVIGAGVVGLAVAAELSAREGDLAVVERHPKFGQETSSRSSEVIHAGIYYPADSLKASLCVEGRRLLYHWCDEYQVPHRQIGKLIVARDGDEIPLLETLIEKGRNNGAELAMLDAGELHAMEPAARGVAAIHSPGTGIVDSHALMKELHDVAAAEGAIFSFGTAVTSLECRDGGWTVGLEDGYRFRSRVVVNAAGLASDSVAAMAGVDPDEAGCRLRWCKGSYFAYAGASPVSRLIYPPPHDDLAGLGVHATLDLSGRLRFGPDMEYVSRLDYDVDSSRRDDFFNGADTIIAGLSRAGFSPDMAGIRPKLRGEGVQDFYIRHEADRGLPGLINLVGIESPGLTACLAIARAVEGLVDEYLK